MARLSFIILMSILTLVACKGGSPSTSSSTSSQMVTLQTKEVSAPQPGLTQGGSQDPAEFVGLLGVEAYDPNALHQQVLANCVVVTAPEHSCALSTLPFMASESVEPSVDQILSRLVVSHQWMGQRFEQALRKMPADLLLLFKSVTAVVIADDIRPSQFSTVTGAIYLDPELLWLRAEEKALFQAAAQTSQTVTTSAPLKFRSWSRYVKDNALASAVYSTLDDSERTIDEVVIPLASLLFHELAHANDFFPPSEILTVPQTFSVFEAAGQIKGRGSRTSDLLEAQFPLSSAQLTHYAQVSYLRQGMYNTQELDVTALNFAEIFDPHPANDDYAFAHRFEDVAMLFEEAMMRYHFDLDRDVGYVSVPRGVDDPQCNDYLLAWGMRNRGARQDIKMRMQLVVESLAPKPQWPAFFASLAEPILLEPNQGWCDSIVVDAPMPTLPALNTQPSLQF